MTGELTGRTAIVTGASRGIGLAVAAAAGRLGAVLSREVWRRRLQRITGVVLVAFGVKVLATS